VTGRWIVRLYDKDGKVVSEADFATRKEAEECLKEIQSLVEPVGGRVEMEEPKGDGG
jgi:hypothetical protein